MTKDEALDRILAIPDIRVGREWLSGFIDWYMKRHGFSEITEFVIESIHMLIHYNYV